MTVVRRCFAVDLHDDVESIARYRAWHVAGAPPSAVTAAIRQDGVVALEIWQVGDRMFMIMEQDEAARPDAETKRARDSANPDVVSWDSLMRTFQKPLPFAPGQTWTEMERIYSLAEQL